MKAATVAESLVQHQCMEPNTHTHTWAYLGVFPISFNITPYFKPPKMNFSLLKNLNCMKIRPNSMQNPQIQTPSKFILAIPMHTYNLYIYTHTQNEYKI